MIACDFAQIKYVRWIDSVAHGVTRVSSLSLSFFLDFLYAKPHLLGVD
jgi:hypothetical protein